MKLDNASLVVAGASGGLGSRLARRLADRGARLVLTARGREALEELDIPGLVHPADTRDPQDCASVVEAAVGEHGGLDGVVDATGVVAFGPLVELDDDTLVELFESNVFGPMRLTRAALNRMDGGFLAHVSAVVAENPVAGMAAYSATKAALTSLDISLHRELRKRNITVFDFRPPHMNTGLAERPISGTSPELPEGLDPDRVADRIIEAIENDERDLGAADFR